MILSLLLASAMAVSAAPLPKALGPVLAGLEQEGFTVDRSATHQEKGSWLSAVILRETGRDGYRRLRVYAGGVGRPRLVYIEPSSSALIEFDPVHNDGGWPRLFGEKSPFLAYLRIFPGVNQASLVLLRHKDGKLAPAAPPFLFGSLEDLDRDGRQEIVSKQLPLGQFFAVECEDIDFHATAQTAFRTSVYAWRGGKPVLASERFASFFNQDIARLKTELETHRGSREYGPALGDAVSIYFDNAELGRRRAGWNEVLSLLRGGSGFPVAGPVGRCFSSVEKVLRTRLGIPEDWD